MSVIFLLDRRIFHRATNNLLRDVARIDSLVMRATRASLELARKLHLLGHPTEVFFPERNVSRPPGQFLDQAGRRPVSESSAGLSRRGRPMALRFWFGPWPSLGQCPSEHALVSAPVR